MTRVAVRRAARLCPSWNLAIYLSPVCLEVIPAACRALAHLPMLALFRRFVVVEEVPLLRDGAEKGDLLLDGPLGVLLAVVDALAPAGALGAQGRLAGAGVAANHR